MFALEHSCRDMSVTRLPPSLFARKTLTTKFATTRYCPVEERFPMVTPITVTCDSCYSCEKRVLLCLLQIRLAS